MLNKTLFALLLAKCSNSVSRHFMAKILRFAIGVLWLRVPSLLANVIDAEFMHKRAMQEIETKIKQETESNSRKTSKVWAV